MQPFASGKIIQNIYERGTNEKGTKSRILSSNSEVILHCHRVHKMSVQFLNYAFKERGPVAWRYLFLSKLPR